MLKDFVEIGMNWMCVILAVMTIFLVMLQDSHGGGLTMLSGTRAAEIEGVSNPVRRFTACIAGLFFVAAIAAGIVSRL